MISITKIFTVVIFLVSFMAFNNRELFNKFLFSPYLVRKNKEWYRLLTAGFLHGNWVHLLVNLFVFWEFGSYLEKYYRQVFGVFGSILFVSALFLGGIVIANLPALFKHSRNMYFKSIGASGGVSAILFSYILINPWSLLYLYFVIPLYSIVVGVLFLIYSYWASKNKNDHIDHLAHFWGSIWGVLFTAYVYTESLTIFAQRLLEKLPG